MVTIEFSDGEPAIGPTGPTGPQGPQGFTGPTGPVASVVVQDEGVTTSTRNTINFIQSTGTTITVADNSANSRANITLAVKSPTVYATTTFNVPSTTPYNGSATQACTTGTLIGGGCTTNGGLGTAIAASHPNVTSGTPTAWHCTVTNNAGVTITARVYAICLT